MVPRRSKRYPAEKVSDFDFSADIVKLGESLRRQVDLPGRKEVDLHITTKTKFITFSLPHASLQLDRKDIDNFGDFRYLGSYIALTEKKKKKHQLPVREKMEYVLEIGSYLEVSCIPPTKDATV